MTPASQIVRLAKVCVLRDAPQHCERTAPGEECRGGYHYATDQRSARGRCPLAWLRSFAESHRDLIATYHAEMHRHGWSLQTPIGQWGSYLIVSVKTDTAAAMPVAKRHVDAIRRKAPERCGPTLLCGKTGTGKTMLATALALTWLGRPEPGVLFLRWGQIARLADIRKVDEAAYRTETARYRKAKVLVIDDLARDRYPYSKEPGSAPTAEVLCDLFDGGPLFVGTANLTRSELDTCAEVGPRALSRMLARRAEEASVFEIDGPDARVGQVREHAAG